MLLIILRLVSNFLEVLRTLEWFHHGAKQCIPVTSKFKYILNIPITLNSLIFLGCPSPGIEIFTVFPLSFSKRREPLAYSSSKVKLSENRYATAIQKKVLLLLV